LKRLGGLNVDWVKVIITPVISGLLTVFGIFLTLKHERKRIIFQSLYADKQALYMEIIKELMIIKTVASGSNSGSANYKGNSFAPCGEQLETYLIRLELFAPADIIKHIKSFLDTLNARIIPLISIETFEENNGKKEKLLIPHPEWPKLVRDPRNPAELDSLDEDIKQQCEKIIDLLRKDLGISNKLGS